MISAAPAMIMGMLMASPRINSESFPLAAAATAMTLSRLMMMSAITTIRIACQRLVPAVTSSPSSSGTRSLAAMTMSATPPTSFR